MQKIKIYSSNKKNLISELKKYYDVEELKKKGFLSKIFKKDNDVDIYFYDNDIDVELDLLEEAKMVIVPSLRIKNQVIQKYPIVEADNINVCYPTFSPQEIDFDEANKSLKKELGINDEKIIFFTSNDFKKAGAKEFVNLVASLPSNKYVSIVAGTKKQIEALKFQISKYVNLPNLFLIDDFDNIDLLFAASDIFILPTSQKNFNISILKAMYYKCGVFVTNISDSSEVVDVFATIESANDGSAPYKISALISNDNDLEKIKQDNHNFAKEFLVSKQIDKLRKKIH